MQPGENGNLIHCTIWFIFIVSLCFTSMCNLNDPLIWGHFYQPLYVSNIKECISARNTTLVTSSFINVLTKSHTSKRVIDPAFSTTAQKKNATNKIYEELQKSNTWSNYKIRGKIKQNICLHKFSSLFYTISRKEIMNRSS